MKVQIFIDGGNFHHLGLKSIGLEEADFDFEKFAEFLAGDREISDLGKRYYVGTVREKEGDIRSKEAMAKQTRLFNELIKSKWVIKTSKLRERTEEVVIDGRVDDYQALKSRGISRIKYRRFREKGIDVKIATDLVAAALDSKYDVAILVSSDTDLIPMVDWIRMRLKKKIEYIGFSIPAKPGKGSDVRPPQACIARTDIQRILIESDLKKFIKPRELGLDG